MVRIQVDSEQKPILLLAILLVLVFSAFYITRQNYEFMIYVGVILFFLALLLLTNHRVHYPTGVLWGLLIWSALHMAGGSIYLGQTRLYELILIPLPAGGLPILRYDQAVHAFGFGVATLAVWHLLRPWLAEPIGRGASLGIVVAMAGLGVGALNEIVEFGVTLVVPDSGVGDYVNTSLDLVANLVGATIAWAWIRRGLGAVTPDDAAGKG